MARDGYLILDSDLHMMEPDDLWARYLVPPYRANPPRFFGAQQQLAESSADKGNADTIEGMRSAAGAVRLALGHPRLALGLHLDTGEWWFDGTGWRPRYLVVSNEDEPAVRVEARRQLEKHDLDKLRRAFKATLLEGAELEAKF